MEIIETPTGVNIILKSSKNNLPTQGQTYWYVAFNVIRGFFSWEGVWRDSEMDLSLYEMGNCFMERSEPDSISEEFNNRLKIRTKIQN